MHGVHLKATVEYLDFSRRTSKRAESVRLRTLPRKTMSIQERLCSHAHSAEPECCSVNRTAESELGTFRMNNAAMNETAALWHGMRGKWRHAKKGILRSLWTSSGARQSGFTFSPKPG